MNKFIDKTIKLNGQDLNIDTSNIKEEVSKVCFLPFYIDKNTNQLMVIIKRSKQPAAQKKNFGNVCLSGLETDIPDKQGVSAEEIFTSMNLPLKEGNFIPAGAGFVDPNKTTETKELVLVEIEAPQQFDDFNESVIQRLDQDGIEEIGLIPFDDLLSNIDFIQDLSTRMIVSELYIMLVEEEMNKANSNQTKPEEGLINGDYKGIDFEENVQKTSEMDDEVIEKNKQMDFGSIYSRKS